MAIKINNVSVDNKYSSMVEPNLYTKTWMIPGVTYTDKYEERAGGIEVPKLVSGGKKDPVKVGSDLTHTDVQVDTIPIRVNNEYGFSQKIKDVQENAVPISLGEAAQQDNVNCARESSQASALACMITEGTVSSDTEAVTAENALQKLIDAGTEIAEKKGTANVVLASPSFYAKLLSGHLKLMTPVTNDKIVTDGNVTKLLNYTVFQVNDFSNGAAKYINSNEVTVTVTADDLKKVDFIMYDSRVFSRVSILEGMRFTNAIDFFGVYAQMQLDCGYKVTTPACMLIKKHAS